LIDVIVKIAGSIFCLGVGLALLVFSLVVLCSFVVEIYQRYFK